MCSLTDSRIGFENLAVLCLVVGYWPLKIMVTVWSGRARNALQVSALGMLTMVDKIQGTFLGCLFTDS
jgi:hypothetical protein